MQAAALVDFFNFFYGEALEEITSKVKGSKKEKKRTSPNLFRVLDGWVAGYSGLALWSASQCTHNVMPEGASRWAR